MIRHFLRFVAILFALICTAGTAMSAPTITKLGATPGGADAYAFALSGNGTTVVGVAQAGYPQRAFRWTSGTGVVDIGPGASTVPSSANDVNADGSVVVGYYGDSTNQAFRWTAATGAQDLGFLPGGSYSFANGVNADGSVVVGWANGWANDATTPYNFRWTAATGIQALPAPSGYGYSGGATGVSADGSVIVGYNVNKGGVLSADRAYRYTDAGGYQDLGVQPGFSRSVASNVSGDGNTVVGFSQLLPSNGTVTGAYRWTQSTGLVPLFFDDEASSYATAVNYDGSRIVGTSIGATGSRAVMWTSTLGSVDLNTYLPTLGVNLTGWDLTGAEGISYDGSVIMGNGTYNGEQAAWIVSAVPEPSTILLAALGSIALIVAQRLRVGARRIRIPM